MNTEADSIPIPPRYWWTKRLAIAFVLFIAAAVVLRWQAQRLAEKRLDRLVQEVRGRGELIELADFAEPKLPEEQDAGVNLLRAGQMLNEMPEADKEYLDRIPRVLPFSPGDMQFMAGFESRWAKALAEVRAARGKKGATWGLQITEPAIGILLPWLRQQRQVLDILEPLALYAHQKGDDSAAIEYIRDILTISQAVDSSPIVICHIIATAASTLACKVTQQIAPTLRPGHEREMRTLIAELLDDASLHEGLARSMQGERMFQYDTMRCLAEGRLHGSQLGPLAAPSAPGRVLSPLFLNEARHTVLASNTMISAARLPDGPSAMAAMAPVSAAPGAKTYRRHPLFAMLFPALGGAYNRHYSALYARRDADIALAGRLYELENGKRASSASELIPRYLPHLPLDPVAGGGQPMPMHAATQPTTRAVR